MMNNATNNNHPDAYEAYQHLLTSQQSFSLATINKDGSPLASYTPFVVDDQRQFYIFVSQLAVHTANLQRGSQASVMLIEDEAGAGQIFARRRLIFQCNISRVARDSDEWTIAMGQYRDRFGKMVDLLSSLPDFQLFKLSPTSGQLTLGFGQAYAVSGNNFDTLTHRGRG